MTLQVSCIKKGPLTNPWEVITDVGGKRGDGSTWGLSKDAAIKGINAKTLELFVDVGGRRALVEVAIHDGKKYLKTKGDSVESNNLLSLPKCPD